VSDAPARPLPTRTNAIRPIPIQDRTPFFSHSVTVYCPAETDDPASRQGSDLNPPNHLGIDPDTARGLLGRAREVRGNAYAPYSRFPVGAALLAADGRVFTGCNVENASYGLANCAERVAIGKAVSEGAREFAAIAVIGPEDAQPCAPCGACRQVLYEFGPDLPVIFPVAEGDGFQVRSMGELLPGAFGPARLAESQRSRGV